MSNAGYTQYLRKILQPPAWAILSRVLLGMNRVKFQTTGQVYRLHAGEILFLLSMWVPSVWQTVNSHLLSSTYP